MMQHKIYKSWREILESAYEEVDSTTVEKDEITENTKEEHEEHEPVNSNEIVQPPQDGEDMMEKHGGNDSTEEIKNSHQNSNENSVNNKNIKKETKETSDGENNENLIDEEHGGNDDSTGETKNSHQNQNSGNNKDIKEETKNTGDGENNENLVIDEELRNVLKERIREDGEGEEYYREESDSNGEEGEDSNNDNWGNDDYYNENQQRNTKQAFDIQQYHRRRVSVALATLLGNIAEDLSGETIEGDDEWDTYELVKRAISKRPLKDCRSSRAKEGIILVLDNSGSCYKQAAFYSSIATVASQQGDVDIYLAPNAYIESRKTKGGWERYDKQWEWVGRKIIFFGDFDGGDDIVRASFKNDVYWFSCETRYERMEEHSWCNLSLDDFRGEYYPCIHEEDFLKLINKVYHSIGNSRGKYRFSNRPKVR